MLPSRTRQKPEHKTSPVGGISALKTSVIFGANASGKSNLVKAIDFGRRIVVNGQANGQIIDYQKFRLDTDAKDRDSRMEFEIQTAGKNFAYGFVFNPEEIVEEWLYELPSKRTQKCIFERSGDKFELKQLYARNKRQEEQQFIGFVAKGTRSNQLFLTEMATRDVKKNVTDIDDILNVYEWFSLRLKVLYPGMEYKGMVKTGLLDNESLRKQYEEFMKYFGTGICGVRLENMNVNQFPEDIIRSIREMTSKDSRSTMMRLKNNNVQDTFLLSRKGDEVVVRKLLLEHLKNNGEPESFSTGDESDGTNRIVDIIPMLLDLLDGNNVFVVDEIERSMHPNLTYQIFNLFLSAAKNINSQLIAATHESSLLNQKLLRLDEVWFVMKGKNGASRIYSLEDYNVRYDKEIRRAYLQGRYKAIPQIGNESDLSLLEKVTEE